MLASSSSSSRRPESACHIISQSVLLLLVVLAQISESQRRQKCVAQASMTSESLCRPHRQHRTNTLGGTVSGGQLALLELQHTHNIAPTQHCKHCTALKHSIAADGQEEKEEEEEEQ